VQRFTQLAFLLLALVLIYVGISDRSPPADQSEITEDGAPSSQESAHDLAPDSGPESAEEEPHYLLSSKFLAEPFLGDFDEMVERRTIRVLVVHSKTFYFFDGAQQRGLTYESMREFERAINRELKTGDLPVSIIFLPVTRDQLIPALLEGRGDIAAANLTITPERGTQIDFSIPLGTDISELLVTGPASPTYNSRDDLAGAEVHARPSSSYYQSLLMLNGEFVAAGKAPIRIIPVDENLEDEDLLEMLNAGLIPAVVVDSHKASFWQQIFEDITVHENIALRTGANIGWAFRKNSPKLAKQVNRFLRKNRQGTLTGNILLTRYLKDTSHVDNILAEDEMEKFNQTIALFQKYAEQYRFDWLMVVSQAYQESRLDHGARSHTGAVGIMQVLPSTAADKNVGIPDITSLENNIHAGNKYLRFIRDRYFDNEEMNEMNKTLFAFAAYNAGPAKVASLRKEARAAGLDPNVWFGNVEVIAARRIGRETVQYVSNIYKYWVAYKLTLDNNAQRLPLAVGG
jgi:membrane-bound lytic murein transglycosylase MltF